MRFGQVHESSGSLKAITLLNHLNEIITYCHGYFEVLNDNAQRQFVYFIIAICRNTLKSFLNPFL